MTFHVHILENNIIKMFVHQVQCTEFSMISFRVLLAYLIQTEKLFQNTYRTSKDPE